MGTFVLRQNGAIEFGFVLPKWVRSSRERGLEWNFEMKMGVAGFVWKYDDVGEVGFVLRFLLHCTVWHTLAGFGRVWRAAMAR
jgi:hypothetical protein